MSEQERYRTLNKTQGRWPRCQDRPHPGHQLCKQRDFFHSTSAKQAVSNPGVFRNPGLSNEKERPLLPGALQKLMDIMTVTA